MLRGGDQPALSGGFCGETLVGASRDACGRLSAQTSNSVMSSHWSLAALARVEFPLLWIVLFCFRPFTSPPIHYHTFN